MGAVWLRAYVHPLYTKMLHKSQVGAGARMPDYVFLFK